MPGTTVRERATAQAAFAHRAAHMIFDLEDTKTIVDAWHRFAKEQRAVGRDDAGTDRELVSVFVSILDQSRRLARAHVAKAAKDLADALEDVRSQLDDATKDLEAEDKLGNFEIQDLMSRYNQAETLASSVLKKADDTASAVIGKI